MVIYRIKDWAKHFENNRTRELVKMAWVPVPNKHDGDGYTDLMSRENAMELYGAWHLILQVASKCDPRGTLSREGAVPHNAASIARVTRGNVRVIEKMLKVGCEIGWIEALDVITKEVTDSPAPSCDVTAPSCIEGKGMEGKESIRTAAPKKARGGSQKHNNGNSPNGLKPLAIWKQLYRSYKHAEYSAVGACLGAARTLKTAYGADDERKLRYRMKEYLNDPDPFHSRVGWTLAGFVRVHNKYGNPPAPKAERQQGQDDAGFFDIAKGKA